MNNRETSFIQRWNNAVSFNNGLFAFEITLEPKRGEESLSDRFWNNEVTVAKHLILENGLYDGYSHSEGYTIWAAFTNIKALRKTMLSLRRKLDRSRISWTKMTTEEQKLENNNGNV